MIQEDSKTTSPKSTDAVHEQTEDKRLNPILSFVSKISISRKDSPAHLNKENRNKRIISSTESNASETSSLHPVILKKMKSFSEFLERVKIISNEPKTLSLIEKKVVSEQERPIIKQSGHGEPRLSFGDSINSVELHTRNTSTVVSGIDKNYSEENVFNKNALPALKKPHENHKLKQKSKTLNSPRLQIRVLEQKVEYDTINDIDKLKHILYEFYATEVTFCKDIELVEEIYLRNAVRSKLFTKRETHYLFETVKPIAKLSNSLIKELSSVVNLIEMQMEESKYTTLMVQITNKICDIFYKMGGLFEKEYGRYFNEYKKSSEIMNRLSQIIKNDQRLEMKTYFETCNNALVQKSSSWDLESILIKPIQRILKYPLFFRELKDIFSFDLSEGHRNYNSIIKNDKLFPVKGAKYSSLLECIDTCIDLINRVANKKVHANNKRLNLKTSFYGTVKKHLRKGP